LDLIKHTARNDLREIGDSAPVFPVPGHYGNVSGKLKTNPHFTSKKRDTATSIGDENNMKAI